jgi:hypothetical protein
MGDTSPKVELNTPLGHSTVRGRDMHYQDGCSEQKKRLDEILQRPLQSARHPVNTGTASPVPSYYSR